MKQFNSKLNLIFMPFLLQLAATVIIWSFLHWLLFIRFHALKVDEDVLNFVAPIVVPGIPVLLWLRPQLKSLRLKSNGKDYFSLYIMMAWLAMIAPISIAQAYLVTATGKLTKLNYIGEIIRQPFTKYYMVKHFYVNKRIVHGKSVFGVSGKYNQYFDMTIYASVPVFDHVFPDTNMIAAIRNSADPRVLVIINGKVGSMQQLIKLPADSIARMRYVNPTLVMPQYGEAGKYGALAVMTVGYKPKEKLPFSKISPVAWLGVKFTKTISNRLPFAEKEALFKQFVTASDTTFRRMPLSKFVYLDYTPIRKDIKYFTEAVRFPNDVATPGEPIILMPVFEPFELRNGNKLAWVFGTMAIGAVTFLVLLLFAPMKSPAQLRREAKRRPSASNWFKLYFIPREGYYVTPILIDINLAIFIVMVFCGAGIVNFDTDSLLAWGGNYRPNIITGEYWRLITSMFLHGGVMHVLLNMYGLLNVGIFLEPVIGRLKYIIGYVATGILAGLTSIWWAPAVIGVGASGAIFGMCGIFLALLTTSVFPNGFRKPFLINTLIFVVLNLLIARSIPGIDIAAHIGGLLSGILLGYAFYPAIKKRIDEKNAEEAAALELAMMEGAAASAKKDEDEHQEKHDEK